MNLSLKRIIGSAIYPQLFCLSVGLASAPVALAAEEPGAKVEVSLTDKLDQQYVFDSFVAELDGKPWSELHNVRAIAGSTVPLHQSLVSAGTHQVELSLVFHRRTALFTLDHYQFLVRAQAIVEIRGEQEIRLVMTADTNSSFTASWEQRFVLKMSGSPPEAIVSLKALPISVHVYAQPVASPSEKEAPIVLKPAEQRAPSSAPAERQPREPAVAADQVASSLPAPTASAHPVAVPPPLEVPPTGPTASAHPVVVSPPLEVPPTAPTASAHPVAVPPPLEVPPTTAPPAEVPPVKTVTAVSTCTFTPVFFAFKRSKLSPEAKVALTSDASCLAHETTRLNVVGHTDKQGPESFNRELARWRAEAVSAFLEAQGISSTRLEISSSGSNHLLCEDDTEACHARNRRVEFLLLP